ncbi:Gfo/Idh/MocA family oxidoreductase [Mesorhizobium sp.]|uniref:Gfo/Idh/MocA family protein n=1 Tax=Mesorhizobium sp. TaxID=1871066 RepID=UPI001211A775|nr:Gfo/Idh/MocA family oxidoreductase [Mesorhizobium sp.]TIS42512.1 MAG: Gfo/Idh/MocA family oxidoreductase [Mesorhizobium sp.]
MTEQGKIRWGLIGASNIAKQWLAASINKHPACEVVSVYSRDEKRASDYARELKLQSYHTSLESLLADPDVDAVYISTTNDKHHDEAIAAAEAGKHILCEKPLTLSVADAETMVEAARKAGVVLGTNHHLRNMATHQAIKEIIASGELGDITSARIGFTVDLPGDLARWRLNDPSTGAGVVLDLTVHDVDLLRYYFDADPVGVTAMGLTSGRAPHGIKDNVMSIWEFPGRLLVVCQDTFLVPFGGTAVEIHGTKGSVHGADVLWQKPQGRITVRTQAGTRDVPVDHVVPYDKTIDDFVDAVRGRGKPSADGVDGLKSLRFALAAAQAMDTGGTVRF